MWGNFIYSIPTLLDLLALVTCIGVLSCRLWVIPSSIDTIDKSDSEIIVRRLWWLLSVGIVVLILSSMCVLFTRTMEMSDRALVGIFPVLPKVLLETHFGRMWLVRIVSILVLCFG